jgi:hypothetical protein
MKFIAFGDSFVNIFLPLKDKNFEIVKFKGALIKGLIDNNENYKKIQERLKNRVFDYAFFIFGNVDLNFYFYKKKYVDGVSNNIIINTILSNTEKYVKLIKELPNIKNKYIINVFPSAITDKNFKYVIVKYGIIPLEKKEDVNNNNIKYKNRNMNIIKFNNLLEKYCNEYNINFCNICSLITNNRNYLDKIFRLNNPYNIHFNNEYILVVLLYSCLRFLCNKKILYSYEEIIEKIKKCSDNYIARVSERDQHEHTKFNINLIESYILKKSKNIQKFINKEF